MRKTFYDLLDEIEFNVVDEYADLLYLFNDEHSVAMSGYLKTMSEYIDKNHFRSLSFRGNFLSIYDMMSEFGLNTVSNNLQDLYVFCEFLVAVMPESTISRADYEKQRSVIMGNINNILEKTNHELTKDPDYDERYIITEKNKAADLAAEIVEDKEIAFELLEYNHYALKGNLSKKRRILVSIGAYVEPMLKDKLLSKAGYKDLESNVGFLLNKFHIRHNNKEGKTAQDYIVSISDDELEKWYDRTYDMLIQAILTNENANVEKDIAQLKKDYKWK